MMVPTSVCVLASALLLHLAAADCPGEAPTKQLLCYLHDIPSQFDPCLCTHLVLQTQLDKLTPESEFVVSARKLQERNPSLRLLLEVTDSAEVALKKRSALAQTVAAVVAKCGLDGVQVALRWGKPTAAKVQLVDFVQTLSKEFDKLEPKDRTKRSYKIHESIVDDIVTPPWRPDNNRNSKVRKTRDADSKESKDEEGPSTTEGAEVEDKKDTLEGETEDDPPKNGKLILMHLTAEPQHLAKNFDLKRLSKYVSLYTLASDNLTDASEHGLAYHPSRLMGIEDILNADSLIDLVTGLGAPHEKLVLALPASALRFTLADKEKNLPQSPVTGEPSKISRPELCKLMSEGEWTVERDEDLTAPYAFHDTTWLAFDDPTSVSIKGKYVLLRDLAGAAVSAADTEDWANKCGSSGPTLLKTLHDTFTNIARKTRAAQLVSLQEQLHEAGHFSYSGDIHLSPYRIVRVVDRAGSIHVVRKEAKTEFECSRQGYFRHPSGCNRFYRCVKFNQYSPDFTVFEYDCPAGLAFDETVEVCVWPGSLADGGACQGSSEIAPVPRSRYVCPQVAGYYADPENCRWFFACLDHQGDGSPLTAYEFRCPFGLVFDEQALVCNWPWLVPGCGGAGVYSARFTVGDFYEGRHRPSYASLSDVHVSGGRIENVPGGVVLGSAVSGIGSGAYLGSYGSGSNALGAGSYSGESGAYGGVGSGSYIAGGAGLGYGSGGLASGSHQSSSVSGSGIGYNGLGYQSGEGGAGSGAYNAAFGSKTGVYSTGGTDGTGYKTTSYSAGSGINSGSIGGAYSSGSNFGAGYNAGSAGYGGSTAGGADYSGANAGSAYKAGSVGYGGSTGGAYYSGANAGSAYKAGSVRYGGSTGGADYSGANAGSAYKAGSVGYGGSTAGGAYSSSTRFGNAGSYGSGAYLGAGYSGAYADNSGAYVEDNSGAYIHDSTGDTGGLYTGKESYGGQYTGGYVAGGAYVPGIYDNGAYRGSESSGGQYKHQYVGGGAYSGSYDKGAYFGSGSNYGKYKGEYDGGAYSAKYDGAAYTGQYDSGAYSGKYDGGDYSGKYDGGAYSGKYDGGAYSGKYDGGAYSGKYDGGAYSGKYDAGSYKGASDSNDYRGGDYYSGGSVSYQGGYKVPSAVVTDQGHGYNVVGHKPAVGLVGLDAVKVTGGDLHSGGYVSSYVTPSPVPAVSVTPIAPVVSTYSSVTPTPISISTYRGSTIQPTTPRPLTYYPVVSSPVTPVTAKPLISYSTVKPPAYIETYQQPSYVKTVTPAPTIDIVKTPIVPASPVTYTYRQPIVKNEYSSTGIQFSTPAPFGVKYSYPQPTVLKTPIIPLNPVQYSTPVPIDYSVHTLKPVSYSTYAPPPVIKTSYTPTVYKTPVVPLNPVQYSTPSPVHFQYSTPAPLVSYQTPAPLKPITYTTPAPPVSLEYSTPKPVKPVIPIRPISYSTPAPPVDYNIPTVLKTPVVPLNPVQYSTPSPIHFEYSTPSPKPVNPVIYSNPPPVLNYEYHPSTPIKPAPLKPVAYVGPEYLPPAPIQPVKPLRPITYTTPAPVFTYEYSAPAVKPVVPAVLKTPVVPLNPIQYTTPAPVVFEYSTPAPVPVKPLRPITYTTPAPQVHYEYHPPAPVQPLRPISYTTPSTTSYEYLPPAPVQSVKPLRPVTYTTPAPVVSYEYSAPAVKPVIPSVLRTPVVPLNPIQYTTPAPVQFEYSTPAPVPVKPLRPISYSTPAPSINYESHPPAPVQPVRPLRPITYTTPAPVVSYEYSAPAVKPVIPSVLRTPVVPLNPIQYTTPAPVQFEYSTPAPVPLKPLRPVSYSTPTPTINYEYHPAAPVQPVRPLRPITYTTPAPVVSYEYSAPAVKPVIPSVLRTPVVPLNPIQYTTPAPVQFEYSTPAPVPLKPLRPVSYSTPAPTINYEYHPPAPVQPLKPLRPITYTTPAPVVSYEYSAPAVKPVIPSVLKTPVVPLNPIQYTTPAPVQFEYSTPAPVPVRPLRPISYSTPAPAINYEYHPPAPAKPLRPITYTTSRPDINYEYLPPAPVQPVKPLRPITYTTPAPVVSYEYSAPAVKPVVPAVLKTPVVPLNPIQYTTPAPVHFEYSTPAPVPVRPLRPISYTTPAPVVNYEYLPQAPIQTPKPFRPITYTTPAPDVRYEYGLREPVQPLKPISISSPAPFSYGFKYQPVKQVPTVLKTPVVPLNPVQYTTPAPAIFEYSTQQTVKPLRPVTYTTSAPVVSYEYSSTPSPISPVTFKSTSYIKPIPTVLKTPAVPLNPIQYSTPAPVVNQFRFGSAYDNSEVYYQPEVRYKQPSYVKTQLVDEGYNYPKPTVKFVETPKIVTTTTTYSEPSEPVTPIYKQVYDYVKTPLVSAYDKVLNAISYSTTPAPLPVQTVTQSPVSYAPVNVGPSYKRPALVKTPSIPVTPVAVVPEYQKVLNVVKATTTPSPVYVNHYTSTYEPEFVPVSSPRPVIYKQKPAVLTQPAYVKDYSYEENVEDLYDSVKNDFGTRLGGGYEEGYVYNQQKVEVPQVNVYTSTTPAPVTFVKETYKVRKPVKTFVETYEQPTLSVGFGADGYEGGSFYSTSPKPVTSSEATFGEQYHKETSFTGYTGHEGDSISYEEVAQPVPVVTSTTQAPTVKITTARVSLPVAPEGGYYVRKQKVRVRPVVTTENYPDIYSSTYTPSTVSTTTFAPTYSYSTTPSPAVTFSTTGHPDDEVDVEGEDEEFDGVKLLEGYNGQFGSVVSRGYSASSTVASIEDGEAIVGVLKKGKITYDGRRTKTKVVVVSKLSDFNPLLVGKLGAECSCNSDSNSLTIRKSKYRGSGRLFVPSKDSTIPDQQLVDTYLTSTSTVAPFVANAQSSAYESSSSYESSSYDSPVVEIRPLRKKTRVYSTTTTSPIYAEDNLVSEGPTFIPASGDRVKSDSVECKRAGLFRHPNKCNKFYSCNWDQWKKKFTLHEFKCPIHLAYDVNLGACNWPSKGPACAEDSLLV